MPRPSAIPMLVLVFALGLAGCTAGPPTAWLALAPTEGPAHQAKGPPIAIAHVAMPPAIDRIYLTSATGANTVHVSSHARWTAPLSRLAQETLARDLAARLPGRRVLMPGDLVPSDARILHVNVTSFMPHPGHVTLDADWQLRQPGGAAAGHGRSRIVEPAADTPAAQARAMSAALGDLADAIAARLAN